MYKFYLEYSGQGTTFGRGAPVFGAQNDENHKAVLDENGKQKTEIVTKEYQTFIPVYVFDVSQTQGDPLPSLATELSEQVESFEDIKRILEEISPVPVYYEDIQGEAKGYFSFVEQKIVIKESLPQLQTIKTMIHEIAHATLGHGSNVYKYDAESRTLSLASAKAETVKETAVCEPSGYTGTVNEVARPRHHR